MRPINVDIENGHIVLGSVALKDMIRNAEDGRYTIRMEEWKQTRRNQQNAFIHVCFDVYGKEMGLSPEESKDYLKRKFGINSLYRDPDTGDQLLLVRHTRTYTIEECSVFIDRLLRHFEYDCNIVIDPELRKQYRIDQLTGELTESA